MPASSWQFLLTDLMGVVHGELYGASERRVALPHLRMATAGFNIPMWHNLADTLVSEECLLQCWRTDLFGTRKLVFNGPINAVDEQTDVSTQTIAATATSPLDRLGKRVLGVTKAGIAFGTEASPIDLGLIAHSILDTVNGQEFTGIDKGTHAASQVGATGIWHLKNAGEAIAELTTGLNSFEFEIEPTVPVYSGGVGGWPRLALMNIAPLIGGVQRDDAVFEYGTARSNVRGYQRAISRQDMLTKGYISVSGWPDPASPELLSSYDAAAVAARGLFEGVVNDAGVIDNGLRQSIVDYHVAIRKQPREVITFKPATNARPSPFTDFNIGDIVRARAIVRGSVRFDGLFRVWGVTFSIDQNGNENNDIELIMP